MSARLIRSILTLSAAGACVAMATPANAQVPTYQFKNYKNENYCLGVSGAHTTPGTHLVTWQCDNSSNQNWSFGDDESETFLLLYTEEAPSPPSSSSRCAVPHNDSTTNNTQIEIQECSTTDEAQDWYPYFATYDSDGASCYWLQNYSAEETSGALQVLGVASGNVANGSNVVIYNEYTYPYAYHADQIWCLYQDGP